ncbi:MAG: VCBS repeat-containing protein, partial [Nitrospinota bacterium]
SRLELIKKFPHAIVGAVFADGDGDGVYELVYAANDRLFISSSITGEVLWESPSTKGMKLNSIMAADLDGNGREEIYVNYVHYAKIKSMIAVNENGRWEIKQKDLPYYFSGNDHGGILAQKSDERDVVGLTVYGVKYDGNEITLEKLFTLPNSGPVGLSRISDNPAFLAGTSRNRKLTVFDEKGNWVTITTALKTGSNQAIDLHIEDISLMDVTAGSTIPFLLLGIKFLKLTLPSGTVIAVPENAGKRFSYVADYIGSYKAGRVRLVEFNSGKVFETLTMTPFIEGWVITSIFTNPGSNNIEIYATANHTGKEAGGRIYRLVIPRL